MNEFKIGVLKKKSCTARLTSCSNTAKRIRNL